MTIIDATPRLSAYFGQGTGSIFRQYLRCSGSESRLVDCSTSTSSCTHSEDAGVTCLPTGNTYPMAMMSMCTVLASITYNQDSFASAKFGGLSAK